MNKFRLLLLVRSSQQNTSTSSAADEVSRTSGKIQTVRSLTNVAMDIPEERGPNDQRPHQPGPSGGYRPGDSDQYSQSVLTRINPMRGVKKFLVSQQEGSETPPSDRTDPFGFPVTSFFGSFTKAGGTSQVIRY